MCKKFAFNFDFLLIFSIVFILWSKGSFLIMELIASLPNDTEVSSGQLKRLSESVIDPTCSMKVEATSFCFNNNIFFSSNISFSFLLLFLIEKYGLHVFQNGLKLQSALSDSKYCNLVYSFRFTTKFHYRLNLTMSLRFLTYLPCVRDVIWSLFGCEGSYQNGAFDSLVKFWTY